MMLRPGFPMLVLFISNLGFGADAPPLKAAHGVLVDPAGMTVYTYDKDEAGSGKSSCVATCARNWPPVKAPAGALPEPWSLVMRTDGGPQLAHRGKPLYTFIKDKKAGDKAGDGVGGAWHVVTVPAK